MRSECIQAIHCGEDAGADGNVLAGKALGITGAVPTFMVTAHNGRYWIREGHPLEDLRADNRVHLHLLEFFARQFSWLVNDLLGHSQLAYVMQERRSSQGLDLVCWQVHFIGDFDGVGTHALQMGMCSVVLGFNGKRERLDGAHVEGCDLLDVALLDFYAFLLRFEPSKIQPVRSVHPVDQREHQQRGLPSRGAVDDSNQAHCGCAYQVIGK